MHISSCEFKYSQCDSLFRVGHISPGEFTFDNDAMPLLLQNSSTCTFFHRRCCPPSLIFKSTPGMQPSGHVARNGTSRMGQRFLSGCLLLIHRFMRQVAVDVLSLDYTNLLN